MGRFSVACLSAATLAAVQALRELRPLFLTFWGTHLGRCLAAAPVFTPPRRPFPLRSPRFAFRVRLVYISKRTSPILTQGLLCLFTVPTGNLWDTTRMLNYTTTVSFLTPCYLPFTNHPSIRHSCGLSFLRSALAGR